MKTKYSATKPMQFPEVWDEEWLKIAIDELDNRKMTYDERTSLELFIARKADAVYAEKRRVEAENREIGEAIESGKYSVKLGIIKRSLAAGLDIELIAEITSVSVDLVKKIEQELSKS